MRSRHGFVRSTWVWASPHSRDTGLSKLHSLPVRQNQVSEFQGPGRDDSSTVCSPRALREFRLTEAIHSNR